jgi:hypothetical protein
MPDCANGAAEAVAPEELGTDDAHHVDPVSAYALEDQNLLADGTRSRSRGTRPIKEPALVAAARSSADRLRVAPRRRHGATETALASTLSVTNASSLPPLP